MLKILIADDQLCVRQELSGKIREVYSNPYEIHEAENGRDAVELAVLHKVNLIFLDMNMPLMDGIEFLEAHERCFREAHIVVLSAFDDFYYTQSAIRHKVDNYILKPINNNELYETLLTAECRILDEDTSDNVAFAKKQNYFSMSFHDFLTSNDIFVNIERLLERSGLQFDRYDNYAIFIVSSDDLPLQSLVAYIDSRLSLKEPEFFCYANGSTVTLIVDSGSKPERDFSRILEVMETIAGRIHCGYCTDISGYSDLQRGYRQAEEAYWYSCQDSSPAVCSFSQTKEQNRHSQCRQYAADLVGAIVDSKHDDLETLTGSLLNSQMLSYGGQASGAISFAQSFAYEFYNEIDACYSYMLPNIALNKNTALAEVHNGLSVCDSLFDVKVILKKWIGEISETIRQVLSVGNSDHVVSYILKYVHDNFKTDLSVTRIANELSMNYSYISDLFSKKMGMKLTAYITSYRLKKSCALLLETNDRVYEVAENTGFHDAKHFGKQFKKHYGLSPGEFRNNNIAIHRAKHLR